MFASPNVILERIPIPRGGRVADFGTGSGHFAKALADRVGPGGKVYAFDAFAPTLDMVSKELAVCEGTDCFTLHADFNEELPLKNNLLQFAVVANTLHAIQNRSRFLSELSRVIEPLGRVLCVDWSASFKNMGPRTEDALTPSEAVRLFKSQGFSTGPMLPAGSHHYAFLATAHTL